MARIVHFEFQSPNLDASTQFFRSAFGWELSRWEGSEDYWLARTGGEDEPGIHGAIMPAPDGQPRTVTTLAVPSLKDALASVAAAGGTIVVEPMAIRGVGWVAYAVDPAGVLFGMHEADPNVS